MRTSGTFDFRDLKEGGYELASDVWVDTEIKGKTCVILDRETRLPLIVLGPSGRLQVKAGYRWDGSSIPLLPYSIKDHDSNMEAGLIHDALYQLMRAGKLDRDEWRGYADECYRELHVQNGGWRWVSAVEYACLRLFAGSAAKPQPEVETFVHSAP